LQKIEVVLDNSQERIRRTLNRFGEEQPKVSTQDTDSRGDNSRYTSSELNEDGSFSDSDEFTDEGDFTEEEEFSDESGSQ